MPREHCLENVGISQREAIHQALCDADKGARARARACVEERRVEPVVGEPTVLGRRQRAVRPIPRCERVTRVRWNRESVGVAGAAAGNL